MTRTFIDSGVLIATARGEGAIAQKALVILRDPNRVFVPLHLSQIRGVTESNLQPTNQ